MASFWTEEEAREAVIRRLQLILEFLTSDDAWELGERLYDETDNRIYIAVEITKGSGNDATERN